MTRVLIRRGKDKGKHGEEGHVVLEVGIGVMLPPSGNARSHQKLEEARKNSFLGAWRGAWPC